MYKMKKILLLLVCLFSFSAMSLADDRPVSFNKLPQKAQVFIKKHFHFANVQKVLMDDDEYEVLLNGGIKIEFGKGGRWKEIETKRRGIPAGVIPERILNKVRKQYGPKVRIMEISRDGEEMEVKLSNGKELEFDRNRRNNRDRDDD